MTKQELLEQLKVYHESDDAEDAHYQADQLLLNFIDDPGITKAYEEVPKWYA